MIRKLFTVLTLVFTQIGYGAEQWLQLTPASAPPGRGGHRLEYDQSSNRLILFGGAFSGPGVLDDTWVLTNANGLGGAPVWTQLAPATTPGPRTNAASAYNPSTNRLMVFGGRDAATTHNDVWVLSNANGLGGAPQWTQLVTSGTPPALRQTPTGVYDQAGNRLMIFSGCADANPFFCFNFVNDAWVLTNADGTSGTPTWQQLAPIGGPPSGRGTAIAGYDPASNRMIIMGGGINGVTRTDTWILTNANGLGGTPQWIELTPTNAGHYGYGMAAAYDSGTNQFFIGPGVAAAGVLSTEVFRLDSANGIGAPAWVQLNPSGGTPPGRDGTQMAAGLDKVNRRYIIFGGSDSVGAPLNDTWVLDLNPTSYTVCLLYDPTKAKKSGSTVPIKIQLCDANGVNLSSPGVVLHAVGVTRVSDMTTGPVEDSGAANTDNDFRYDSTLGGSGGYIFNLSSAGLASGTYNLNFNINGVGPLLAAPFEIR